jgi:predicted DNA-binding transcriptional regulator YafY
MMTEDEIEVLLIGARIVESWADSGLALAARDALAKVKSVLPDELRERALGLSLAAPPSQPRPAIGIDVAALRRCVREQRKVRLAYLDLKDVPTERVVWPLCLAFFPPVWLLLGWCELRADFRPFRLDRIATVEHLDERYRPTPGWRLVD